MTIYDIFKFVVKYLTFWFSMYFFFNNTSLSLLLKGILVFCLLGWSKILKHHVLREEESREDNVMFENIADMTTKK
jgi:hypothetical protein